MIGMKKKHYDFGIVGVWMGCNYGSVATYYALNQIVTSFGKSVLMIDKPVIVNDDVELSHNHSRRFANEHYNISKQYRLEDFGQLNELCDGFIIGSDQVWNYGISKHTRKMMYLDFASDEKKKIAYAASFGHGVDFAPEDERIRISKLMARFDGISVRESDGVRLCEEYYGIRAVQVLDPVFLLETRYWEELVKKSDKAEKEKYLFTYILDPTDEKRSAIQHVAGKLGNLKIVNILDGLPWLFSKNEKLMNLPNCVRDAQVEDWLCLIRNAEYVITDSCHGASFALIFRKPFMAIVNRRRGYSRFASLSKLLKFEDRLVTDISQVFSNDKLLDPIDYSVINQILDSERKRSLDWLKSCILSDKLSSEDLLLKNYINEQERQLNLDVLKRFSANPDVMKIKILATLLRDYGVKDVVLSPGGRDAPLVRIFENNQKHFRLHRITDERSAAYFGLGIAAQSRTPVACVCTSGTAVSNYLPAVTEAFYTGVPMIVITADRYRVYHFQGEDQTITQDGVFASVVKKSFTVPEGTGFNVEYQTRRDISDCILEATHNGFGPVHINIAIGNISAGSTIPVRFWQIQQNAVKPHIMRAGAQDPKNVLGRWVTALRRSERILVIYGQNPVPTSEQLKNIEKFASKYNCVFLTDHISNLHIPEALQTYRMLLGVTQAEFDEKLTPDIVITVGGKSLMNDPVTGKLRHGLQTVRHWSVNPSGSIRDTYFRLTSVIEMSQDRFFEYFSEYAGNIENNRRYFNVWNDMNESVNKTPQKVSSFNSLYVQSRFLPSIPDNSLLHLGVGLTFIDCRRFSISKTVEVFCNMGTNGIDGCTSTFMGQCAAAMGKKCFLIVGDLSFFYDMNSIWNKELGSNIRILLVNNNGSGLLRGHKLKGISSVHNTSAKGWVESTGFTYISASSKDEFEQKLEYFVSDRVDKSLFFEVFCS